LISNIDVKFNERLTSFADRYNIKYHVDDRIVNNGRSVTYRFHSYVLCCLIGRTFGTNSLNKRIPLELLESNLDFLKGMVEGYYSGDGYIPIKENSVLVTSVSKSLLEDMRLVLLRFKIKSSIIKQQANYDYAIKKGFNAQMPYMLRINAGYTKIFAECFTLEIDEKNERLMNKQFTQGNRDDVIPSIETEQWGNLTINKNELEKYMSECSNELDKKIFESLLEEDIIYDRVVAIEEIVSDHPWVYDLTVKKTRNFNIYNGLCMRDTFHNAGVGAKSIVTTTGVPRIREIINVAKTIKSPSMRIFLKDEFTTNHNKAKMIGNQIEFTKLQDIVDKTMIIYENTNLETNISEDLEFIQTYQEFAQMIGVSTCPPDQLSKWVLRVIFNKEKMMNKNIYLSDIQDYIQRSNSEDEVQCTFSDDNAKEIMMRIRLREDATNANFLQLLQDVEKSLMSIPIRGILGVEKAIPENVKRIVYQPDGSYSQTNEWHLATNGVNLLDVLMNENVDPTRTLSNDINEVAEIFGIEATRSIIIRELMSTPQYDVNYRHISLLGDIMTHRGVIMPIERHGINRSAERGPIAKATFEESTEILVKASTFAEKDKMGGVSANIMFGQLPRVGTNAFDLLFDESKFMTEMKNIRKTEVKNREENKENLVEEIEDKLSKDYPENLGDTIDSQFDFVVDTTKNAEKQLTPHLFPETGLGKAVTKVEPVSEKQKVEEPKKRTIMLKKK